MITQTGAVKEYSIRTEWRPDYLFVHVSGEADSLETSTGYWREVRDLSRQHQVQKVLVQENFQDTIDEIDIYALNNRISQMGFFNTRIAFVDEQTDQFDLNVFGANICANKGLKIRVFKNLAEAEKWLQT